MYLIVSLSEEGFIILIRNLTVKSIKIFIYM